MKKLRNGNGFLMSNGQLKNEIAKCEYCENKPCQVACPSNCSPADFIMAAKLGNPSDFRRAAGRILENNPLGGICGMVCPDRHCMSACVYNEFDYALDIPNIQSTIIQKAKDLGVMPEFKKVKQNGKKIAIIGAGPAGVGAAMYLAQKGFKVEIFEKEKKAGGACNLIPEFRLPQKVLKSDLKFALSFSNIKINYGKEIKDFKKLLKKYNAVIVSIGLPVPYKMNIPNEDAAVSGTDFLKSPKKYKLKNKNVVVIGGGATAADCAFTAKTLGAKVEIISLELLAEMGLDVKEMRELVESGIDVNGRLKVTEIIKSGKRISGIKTVKIELPAGKSFNLRDLKDIKDTEQTRSDINFIIIAVGNHSGIKKEKKKGLFYAGDCDSGPSTVVEAVASGKNTGLEVEAFFSKKIKTPKFANKNKSMVSIDGYDKEPVSLQSDFFGKKIKSPFILSAAPPTDGYEQVIKAYDAGWAGVIMKTAFDNVDIHIPEKYMCVYDEDTYGNCDNVSGHSLKRVCSEIKRIIKKYPDRLTMASTGGPVTGNDKEDKKGWQSNTKKLEKAGAMGIEYSLSCPQGGDGTEGDIVSQNAELTAKIIDWVMEISDPKIPKLFKLTGAVTSIIPIANAIKKVFKKYPNKKAGITLANTFPTLQFQSDRAKGPWEKGVVIGMSGKGVTPISNLNLANVSSVGLHVSGNGGPMDYKAAADFLSLGVKTVQFCTLVTKYGYNIYDEIVNGISEIMKDRKIKSMKELIGVALKNGGPIVDFMDLSPIKKISDVNADLCEHCGNCTRCPYLAISPDENGIPKTDPSKCIGCGICTLKCFSNALFLRKRTKKELALLKED